MSDRSDFLTVANRLLTLAMTQHNSADFLCECLEEARHAVGGLRAFLARIEQETGELVAIATAGPDWSEDLRRLRLKPHNETERGITGYVAITGKPYVTSDINRDPHYLQIFPNVQSEIAVPFFDAEGRVRGVLNVDSTTPSAFTSEHITLLSTFANAIAASLAFEEYRNRERMLIEIGMELASTTDIDPLSERVIEVTARALRCEACSVFLLDEVGEILRLQASRGALKAMVGEATYRLGEGLTGTVAATGEPIRLDDPRDDPRWKGKYAEFHPDERSAFLAVPVLGRGRILGVVRVSRTNTLAWFRARFTEGDERVLRTVASQLGIAIENIRAFDKLIRAERMAAWGELSAKSAHMIGNRTFAIKGDLNELKYLLSKCEKDADLSQRDMCHEVTALTESIEQGVFRLEDILREFRDFVMATSLTRREADINQVLREVLLETFPKRSPVHLEQAYAEGTPLLRADVDKLKRAFGELIENAVSFMPEGGTLRVRTTLIAPGEGPAIARLSPTRSYVQIEFADEGPGVPADIKSKIFTPFFSSRVKGMGLGLSIVKGIVDAHYGSIREVGEAGSGALFLIYLPVE